MNFKPRFKVEDYNFALANRYLSRFRGMIEDKKLRQDLEESDGPFLISTLQPLPKIPKGKFPLLCADLSRHHPSALADTIMAYRRYICNKRLQGLTVFDPLIYKCLTLYLYANTYAENVQQYVKEFFEVVKPAYARNKGK